jgi:hypothetical protein
MKIDNQEVFDANVSSAIETAIENIISNEGHYTPYESWGPEGNIYPGLLGVSLCKYVLDSITKNLGITALDLLCKTAISCQLENGSWPLELGKSSKGMRFDVDSSIVRSTYEMPDIPSTASMVWFLSEYSINIKKNETILNSISKGLEYLDSSWNPRNGFFEDLKTNQAVALRANPRNYDVYLYKCFKSVKHLGYNRKDYVEALFFSITKEFETSDKDTYPLLYAFNASVLYNSNIDTKWKEKNIVRLTDHLGLNSPLKIPEHPGYYGHKDGVRGVVLNEAHLRNTLGVIISQEILLNGSIIKNKDQAFKLLTECYKAANSFFNGNYFTEFIDLDNLEYLGNGSPAQFLPALIKYKVF